jgi:excisionase family DNA binding protein
MVDRIGYSIKDLKEQGICSTTKAYALIAEGKLKAVKVGRKTVITGDSVRALLEAA